MAEIAREAGVSKPRLYRHFADKAELHAAVAERTSALVCDRLRGAMHDSASPAARLRAAIRAYVGVLAEHPGVFRFVRAGRLGGQPGADCEAAAGVVATLLRGQLHAFGIDSPAAAPWAHGLVGAVEAAGAWWLDQDDMPQEAFVEHLTVLVGGAVNAALRSVGVPPEGREPTRQTREDDHDHSRSPA